QGMEALRSREQGRTGISAACSRSVGHCAHVNNVLPLSIQNIRIDAAQRRWKLKREIEMDLETEKRKPRSDNRGPRFSNAGWSSPAATVYPCILAEQISKEKPKVQPRLFTLPSSLIKKRNRCAPNNYH